MTEQDKWYDEFEDNNFEPKRKTKKYHRSKFKPKRKKNFNKQSDYLRQAQKEKD